MHPFVWISLGLMAFWMILSLAGGPSALVFHALPELPLLRPGGLAGGRPGLGGGADRALRAGQKLPPAAGPECADRESARARGQRRRPGRGRLQRLAGGIGQAGVGRLAEAPAAEIRAGRSS